MKLLLDENLSRRLVPALQPRFPGSSQVALLGLERSTDAQLCDYAIRHDFVMCSKDDDFQRLVAARGYRPKLIHLALGNVGNDVVLAALHPLRCHRGSDRHCRASGVVPGSRMPRSTVSTLTWPQNAIVISSSFWMISRQRVTPASPIAPRP